MIGDVQQQASDIRVGGTITNFQTVTINNGSDPNSKYYEWISASAPNPSTTHNRLLEAYKDGTGTWIFDNDMFRAWREGGGMLCVTGIPGNGKSMLCAKIIETLREDYTLDKVPIAWFYFDFREASKQTVEGLLRSLITQLFPYFPTCPPTLETCYQKNSNGTHSPSKQALQSILKDMINKLGRTYIVLDALDECDEQKLLSKFIQSLHSASLLNFHLLIFTRAEQSIIKFLSSLNIPRIDLNDCGSNLGIRKDMAIVIESELEDPDISDQWDLDTVDLIRKTLLEKGLGMFRWVALQLESLKQCGTCDDVIDALSSLPRDLDFTYTRILKKMDDLNTINKLRVFRALQWLCYSLRPVLIEDLAEAVSIGDDSHPSFDSNVRFLDPKFIVRLCSGLVTTSTVTSRSSSEWKQYSDRPLHIVQLSHFSVKEYLASSSRAGSWLIDEHDANISIIRTCVESFFHLSPEHSFSGKNMGDIMEHPLMSYTSQFLLTHVKTTSGGTHYLRPLPSSIPIQKRLNLLHFLFVKQSSESVIYSQPKPITSAEEPIEAAVYTGIPEVVTDVIRLCSKNHLKYRSRWSLGHASSMGYTDIVQLLLAEGADANSASVCSSPIHDASAKGHEKIVALLINAGADVNQIHPEVNTSLQVSKGISLRADRPLMLISFPLTPLSNATKANSLETTRLLLKNGANPNGIPNGMVPEAKSAIRWTSSEDIVQLLLKYGAIDDRYLDIPLPNDDDIDDGPSIKIRPLTRYSKIRVLYL